MTEQAPPEERPPSAMPNRQSAAIEGPRQGLLADLSTSLNAAPPVQRVAAMAPNRTGLPNALKSGMESMARMSLDHVRVHRNSAKPAQLNAHAYAQGSDIHLAPGQERHLPHELAHVVQQAQGRVKPTMQMKMGMPINDDQGLEAEADMMGAKALASPLQRVANEEAELHGHAAQTVQRVMATGSALAVIQRAGVRSELKASEDDFKEFMDDTNTIEDTRTAYATAIYNMYKPNPALGGPRGHFSLKIPGAAVNPNFNNAIALDKAKRLTKWTSTAINSASRIYHELVAATQINDGLGEDYAHITFGQDTDLEADVMTNDTTALEVKRIDSDSQGAVDGHITKVSQQLEKRVDGYNGEEIDTWIAKIKIDSQKNPWPYTPVALAKAVANGTVDTATIGEARIRKYGDASVSIRYIIESENQDIGNFDVTT